MAVIITDMDKPKRCIECPMHENSNDYCKFRHDFSCFVRAKNACPLRPADEMIKEIEKLSNANPSYWNTCDVVDREDVLDIIHKYTDKEQTDE